MFFTLAAWLAVTAILVLGVDEAWVGGTRRDVFWAWLVLTVALPVVVWDRRWGKKRRAAKKAEWVSWREAWTERVRRGDATWDDMREAFDRREEERQQVTPGAVWPARVILVIFVLLVFSGIADAKGAINFRVMLAFWAVFFAFGFFLVWRERRAGVDEVPDYPDQAAGREDVLALGDAHVRDDESA